MLPKRRYMEHYNHKLITQLRLTYFERKRLLKAINQNTNQIAQFLAIEFPEVAERDLCSIGRYGHNPTLGHVAGISINRQWPKENTGIGISKRTVALAIETLEKQTSVMELDSTIDDILSAREFTPYLEVFDDFGFGHISAGMLLKCYPIERFLDGGKIIRDRKGNNLSLRQFQAYLGLGYTYAKSGDGSHQSGKVKKSWQGSRLTRSDLYAWIFANPCKVNKFKPKTETQRELADLWKEPRERTITRRGKDGKKEAVTVTLPSYRSLGKDGICRMEFALSRKLFGALVRAIERLEF